MATLKGITGFILVVIKISPLFNTMYRRLQNDCNKAWNQFYLPYMEASSTWDMAYGPCLEPGLAQTNNGFTLLTTPTLDPSRPLAYWDKLRLLFHGSIHLLSKEMRLILPSTFNPYNSVEYLELRMTHLDLSLLTNTKLTLEGAVQLLVHTASKYDECELFDFPKASASITLNWFCGGKDPNRHHDIVRCILDKLPVRPDKQEHDSYSSFRSQNLDLECKLEGAYNPSVLLYSSTLRSLQQYQMLLKWNVTRPTKKGRLYKNLKPKRPPLMRHLRNVKLSVGFCETVFRYWSSQAFQRGVECNMKSAELSLGMNLTLVPTTSGLIQRHQTNWTICRFDGWSRGITAHVKQSVGPSDLTEAAALKDEDHYSSINLAKDHDTSILLSVEKIKYCREDPTKPDGSEYIHKLEAMNTRLLWNSSNRNIVLGLYDAFQQTQELKRYLSTEALKSILSKKDIANSEEDMLLPGERTGSPNITPHHHNIPRTRHTSSGNTMLDQLLLDINNKYVKYVDESAPSDPQLKGILAISMNDITNNTWLVTLTNTQVVLQGIEQKGYVVASSHMANIYSYNHEPKMKNGVFVGKKSLVGKIQELQCFTTQFVMENFDHVPWLPISVIQTPGTHARTGKGPGGKTSNSKIHADQESNLNALLGTLGPSEGEGERPSTPMGEAKGGTVNSVMLEEEGVGENGVGVSAKKAAIQLQRVAPRCDCQVIYVTYGDQVEAEITRSSSPGNTSPCVSVLSSSSDVDTFTFRYPSVEVCTTSYQYALMVDIVNNLLLHKEMKKKEVMDRHARMQFELQLSSKIKDPRKAVLTHQNKVKKCLLAVRKAETALFLSQREDHVGPESLVEQLETRLASAKDELSKASLKLSVLVHTFRQSQLHITPNLTNAADPMRRIEIWVDKAHWSLTDSDGQLQLADIRFTNFSYNRLTFSDDSGEHRVELKTFRLENLMPNTPPIYKQVLIPYDPKEKDIKVDKNVTLRVYCKDRAPVARISVKEHLEVNVVPLTVCLTARFFQTMHNFFFPKAEEVADVSEPDHSHLFGPPGLQPSPFYGDMPDGNSPLLSRGSSLRRSTLSITSNTTTSSVISTNTSPPLSPDSPQGLKRNEDIEKMKKRATKTMTFIYVKIPQTPLCITYKAGNVSYKDLQNQRVTVPTLEYHNRNWTWTDMLMEVKKDYRNAIVQQTIKSAIGMRGSDEMVGLNSPKLKRHTSPGDLLMGPGPQIGQNKSGKSKKLFGMRSSASRESDEETTKTSAPSSPRLLSYQPPLADSEIGLKRTMRSTTKLTQNAQNKD